MTIDNITYTQNSPGNWTKTVTDVQVSTVTNVNAEVAALNAQLASFQATQAQSSSLPSAIQNYQQQITLLATDPTYVQGKTS